MKTTSDLIVRAISIAYVILAEVIFVFVSVYHVNTHISKTYKIFFQDKWYVLFSDIRIRWAAEYKMEFIFNNKETVPDTQWKTRWAISKKNTSVSTCIYYKQMIRTS